MDVIYRKDIRRAICIGYSTSASTSDGRAVLVASSLRCISFFREFVVPGPSTMVVSFITDQGSSYSLHVFDFVDTPGVVAAMCNSDKSITEFTYTFFHFAIRRNFPLF